MASARRGRHWRPEQSPGHDLRMYEGAEPTPVVARAAWDLSDEPGARVARGPDVWLVRAANRIQLLESRPARQAVRMQLPLASCVDAALEEGPGLPGIGLLRLSLSVRMGDVVSCQLRLWFHATAHALLRELVDEITAVPPPTEPATLPPLTVRLAPDHEDWLVFRAADDGVIVSGEPEEQP